MEREVHGGQPGRAWLLGVTAVLLLVFKLAVVDRMETVFRHSKLRDDGTLPGVAHPLNRAYADGLLLIGYDKSAGEIAADGSLRIDLRWTVRRQPSRRYQTVIHLVGPDGLRWSPSDSYRPTDYEAAPPTDTWTPGRHALDSHVVEPLPGTPPGTYEVVLTVFDRETLSPLSVVDAQLQPTAPELTLDEVVVAAPRSATRAEELGIGERRDVPLGPLTLLGARLDRERAAPGDPVFLTTFWRVDEEPAEELSLVLELLGPDGSPAAGYDFPPGMGWYPVSAWRPDDVWRGQHQLRLPANLETATYAWRLSLLPSRGRPVSLGELSVEAPERAFAPPPMGISVGIRLGDFATLVGATLGSGARSVTPGGTVTVTLVWRAEAETDRSYRVFVHLLDREGKLVAQSDGIPASWRRPTTGWLAGEYITDEHSLVVPSDAPAGMYKLVTGMYLPPMGERLAAPDGRETIRVTDLRVEGR